MHNILNSIDQVITIRNCNGKIAQKMKSVTLSIRVVFDLDICHSQLQNEADVALRLG